MDTDDLEPDPYEDSYDPVLEARAEEERQERASSRWAEVIPRRFWHASPRDFSDQSPEVLEAMRDWTSDPAGRNLLLCGPVGVGKTRAAVCAAGVRYFNHREWSFEFWPAVDLLDALRPGVGTGGVVMDEIKAAQLLVIDDLGTEKPTEWTAERLYAVVNRRWGDEAPTIFTSNLPLSRKTAGDGYSGPTLDEAVGSRMFSRIVDGAVMVWLAGRDRRR